VVVHSRAASARLSGPADARLATFTTRGQLADLELRHRGRARAEDRIRGAKETGLASPPLHDFASNEICCAFVALAGDLLAWIQPLARLSGPTAAPAPG